MPILILLGTEEAGHTVDIDGRTYRPVFVDSSGRPLVAVAVPFTPTSTGSGQLDVTTAGTRVQLPAQACKAVLLKAKDDNTGDIYVGDSGVTSSNGLILDAGDMVALAIDNLDRLYIDSSVDGEGISYLWVS